MGDNGAGTFTPPAASFPEVPDTLIDATRFDATILDMATAISNRICKDGQTTVTANIPFNNFKATGMAQGTARTDSATLANIQDGTGVYTASVGGTPNAITLTISPAIAAYTAGQMFRFLAASTNTAAVTVAVSGLAAKALTKNGTTALASGDLIAGGLIDVTYDGTQFLLGSIGLSTDLPLTGGTLTGNLLFTDGLFDIGASGAARPRDLYLSRALTIGGNVSAAGTMSGTPTGALLPGKAIEGLTYGPNASDAVNDIDIAVGSATSTHATPASRVLLSLSSAITKRLDAAWVTGTNQGGLSSSLTIGNNDYYLHLIRVASVDDVGFDTSVTAANLIADHAATHTRLIGWFKRVGGTIVAFHTYETEGGGLELLWDVPTLDINLLNTLTTSRRTDAVKVPLTFSVVAKLHVVVSDTSGSNTWIGCPDHTDAAASSSAAPLTNIGNQSGSAFDSNALMYIRTSSTGTIAARAVTATVNSYLVATHGFIWARRN